MMENITNPVNRFHFLLSLPLLLSSVSPTVILILVLLLIILACIIARMIFTSMSDIRCAWLLLSSVLTHMTAQGVGFLVYFPNILNTCWNFLLLRSHLSSLHSCDTTAYPVIMVLLHHVKKGQYENIQKSEFMLQPTDIHNFTTSLNCYNN